MKNLFNPKSTGILLKFGRFGAKSKREDLVENLEDLGENLEDLEEKI